MSQDSTTVPEMVPGRSIPFTRPGIVGNEIRYIQDAIRRGKLSGDGHYTRQCNEIIQERTGAPRALITHSCTAALEMAALLCDLEPGDEVILPSFTFASTANAVALRRATPVFVDIDPATLNIDPGEVARAVTPRTRAIFAVHYAGFASDMNALRDIADRHDLILVEDAAQAFGSTYHDRPCGSLGDLGAFSFHETKNVISGEGGALTINRPDMIQRAEIIREKGTNRSQFFRGQVTKYEWMDVGSSYLPGELIAAYLYAQLEVTEAINQRRISVFSDYAKAFGPLETAGRVGMPKAPEGCVGNGHMFYLTLRDLADRTAFIDHMKAHHIGAPFHYVPLHSAPAGRKFGRTVGDMTVTGRVSATLVRLPMTFDDGAGPGDVIDAAMAYFDTAPD